MSSGHGVHVVDFAIRTPPVVIGRAVPAGQAGFDEYGFGVGRKRRHVLFFSRAFLVGIFFVSRLRGFGLRFSCSGIAARLIAVNFARSFGRLRWLNRWRRGHIHTRLFLLSATGEEHWQQAKDSQDG